MRLTTPLEIKRASLNDAGEFSGYAAVFGNVDAYGDVISPGAFARTLKKHQTEQTAPALLWAHDQAMPIGACVDLAEDDYGLNLKGQLTLEVEKAREAHALMKAGALALSIGYQVPAGGAVALGHGRELRVVDLYEVSAVAVPANQKARITEVKSIRDFEAVLRDELGCTSRQAKRLAAGGYNALTGRDGSREFSEQTLRDIYTKARELQTLIQRF